MNNQRSNIDRTRENLINAFWQLYKEKPIEKISIRELAEKAGYSRSTFYVHYTDIFDLRDQLEDSLLHHIAMQIHAIPTSDRLPEDVIHSLVSLYENYGEYLYHLYETSPDFRKKAMQMLHKAVDFKPEIKDNTEKEICIELNSSALLGGLMYWYKNRDHLPADEIIPVIRKYLYRGMCY